MMTAWDRVFSYFPLMMVAATFAALGVFAQWPGGWSVLLVFFVMYLLPPMVQRVMFRWAPLKLGVSASS